MSTQQTLSFNPPRMLNVPQQPLPQTVQMTLEHSGIPYDEQELITAIPNDFGWMTLLQIFSGQITMNKGQNPNTYLGQASVGDMDDLSTDGTPNGMTFVPWTAFPLLCSKWWNGVVGIKLIAIKPPRVTGKILIRYTFDPGFNFAYDTSRRNVLKEWDLGQSNECEFDISAVNTIKARPTWLPNISTQTEEGVAVTARQSIPIQEFYFGKIELEVAARLQPGSIFPDSIRILMFRVYKVQGLYMPTDFRGSTKHFLCTGTAALGIQQQEYYG